MKSVLMLLSKNRDFDESWMLHHAKCTIEELNELVEKGYLIRIDKDPKNFMSDNKYRITQAGCELAWR